jgi:hypothetical protein
MPMENSLKADPLFAEEEKEASNKVRAVSK